MNVTLTLDDSLVRAIRKIAAERETTMAAMVRGYLQQIAEEHSDSDRKRRDVERLSETFSRLQSDLGYGERTWKREDLYVRKSK